MYNEITHTFTIVHKIMGVFPHWLVVIPKRWRNGATLSKKMVQLCPLAWMNQKIINIMQTQGPRLASTKIQNWWKKTETPTLLNIRRIHQYNLKQCSLFPFSSDCTFMIKLNFNILTISHLSYFYSKNPCSLVFSGIWLTLYSTSKILRTDNLCLPFIHHGSLNRDFWCSLTL